MHPPASTRSARFAFVFLSAALLIGLGCANPVSETPSQESPPATIFHIEGTVTYEDGSPLAFITVLASVMGTRTDSTTTGADGGYAFILSAYCDTDLVPINVYPAPPDPEQPVGDQFQTLQCTEEPQRLDFVYRNPVSTTVHLEGTARWDDGLAIPSTRIEIWDYRGGVTSTNTGADGAYTVGWTERCVDDRVYASARLILSQSEGPAAEVSLNLPCTASTQDLDLVFPHSNAAL